MTLPPRHCEADEVSRSNLGGDVADGKDANKALTFGGIFVYNSKREVSQMRWLSRLLVIVVCLIAIALPTAPAQADGAVITLDPISEVPGVEVTVRGYNFTANDWVDIYYYMDTTDDMWIDDVKADGSGDFRLTFIVPESYKGAHEVLAEDESAKSASMNFDVEPGLTVDPEDGPVGTNVTVEGHGFAKNEEDIELRYYLDGSDYETVTENIEADEDGSWETSFRIPPSSKGSHRIDAKGDSSSLVAVNDATFEVTPGISIDESSGSVGESITMTASGFAANERDIKILFDEEELVTDIRADDTGYWEENFEVPEMPKGTYSITAEGERTPKEDIGTLSFEIKPGLVLSPNEGHVGTNLTVTGLGFAINKNVVVKYDDSQKATAATNNKGSFESSFTVPESQYGGRQVTAEDAAGNNATSVFTMESDPPDTPELISPPDGSRVGFMGRVRPTFEWSAVSDASGVRYSLQIATSANVTATGFADPVVSITDIVGTNYTLGKTETLRYGTYYWIVQAVDGAANAGNWTAARSFQAGRLPLWAFILIILAIVALIGALVYFLVIRRRMYYY
jgi:hypothetical protein